MKIKRLICVLTAAVCLCGSGATTAFADTSTTAATAKGTEAGRTGIAGETNAGTLTGIKVDINGKYLEFDEKTGIPFIDENQRTLVPIRAAMEEMGCQVEWKQQEQSAVITKDGNVLEVPVGKQYVKLNGVEFPTDTKAVLKNGRIYLPLRVAAEYMGAEVNWNQKTQTVVVGTQEAELSQVFVHFIDVGHGDSVLIDCGDYEVLIDAGLSTQGAIVADYIKPYVDGSLELVIGTHGHQDHIGGMPDIFNAYKVERLIDSGSSVDTDYYRAYRRAFLKEKGCKVSEDEDEIIKINENVSLQIIEVLDNDVNQNNNSVTAVLTVGEVKVLLAGDNQTEAEEVLVQRLAEMEIGKIDVFKADHHGSRNANSQELLDTIQADYMVVSAGRGVGYYHPHITALKRMLSSEAVIYGTFLSGNIVMKTDGLAYSFSTNGINLGEGSLREDSLDENEAGAERQAVLTPLKVTDAGTYQNHIE